MGRFPKKFWYRRGKGTGKVDERIKIILNVK
jgi:hypothetical protein